VVFLLIEFPLRQQKSLCHLIYAVLISQFNFSVIKPVIVDTACLDNSKNSCLNNYVKPNSKDSGTQDKVCSYLSSLWEGWSYYTKSVIC
jgi:hypothetical protein